MTEFVKRYYPTICVRRAEMKAMEMLPETEKTKMLPVVLLAPWLNSIEFDNTFRIIKKSVGNGPIIVDLDRYFASESGLPSRQYFKTLIDAEIGPAPWMDLVERHANYIPCIQFFGVSDENIHKQIEFAKKLNRGFVFRIELSSGINLNKLLEVASSCIDENLLIIIDYGYVRSYQIVEVEISNIVDRFISISDAFRFVITGASFPNSFSDYDNFSEPPRIYSRTIYEDLARKYGNYNFFYGDWASTKPRSYDGGGGTPLPRIDFPTFRNWIIARSKEQGWDFQTAAEMITRSAEWQSRPMIWGSGMIEKSAKGLPGGIATGPQAIAARVNIHLYLQNNYGTPPTANGPKGKWVDPI